MLYCSAPVEEVPVGGGHRHRQCSCWRRFVFHMFRKVRKSLGGFFLLFRLVLFFLFERLKSRSLEETATKGHFIFLFFFLSFFGGSKNAKTLGVCTRWRVSKWNSLRNSPGFNRPAESREAHIRKCLLNKCTTSPGCWTAE